MSLRLGYEAMIEQNGGQQKVSWMEDQIVNSPKKSKTIPTDLLSSSLMNWAILAIGSGGMIIE